MADSHQEVLLSLHHTRRALSRWGLLALSKALQPLAQVAGQQSRQGC